MIYLDNSASSGHKPDNVINAVTNAMRHLSANAGRGGHSMAIKCGMLVTKTRASLNDFLDNDGGEIVFTANCTTALNYAILGGIKPNCNVITTAYEHNSVLRPLHHYAKTGAISLTILRPNLDGYITKNMIASACTRHTKAVVVNHISNVTGAKTDLKTIGQFCKANGILFVVDGAQSIGYERISMREYFIDMLAIAPHKGLHAPQGVGVLAISKNVAINPVIFGGTGTNSTSLLQPKNLPESLESGTLPLPAIAGLNASISYTQNNFDTNKKRISAVTHEALSRLSCIPKLKFYMPKKIESGIIAFNIVGKASFEVADTLSEQFDICVRAGLHCAPLIHKHLNTTDSGIVRCSMGIDTTFDDIDTLASAVETISKK